MLSASASSERISRSAQAAQSEASHANQLTVLARLSALSPGHIDALSGQRIGPLVSDWTQRLSTYPALASSASETLHYAIGRAPDPQSRAAMLRVRRAIHNRTMPAERDLALLPGPSTQPAVVAALEALKRLKLLEDSIRERFDADVDLARGNLLSLCTRDPIRAGLALSSQSLCAALRSIGSESGAAVALSGSRAAHVLRGGLRYASRAARKATPFGAFCEITEVSLSTWEHSGLWSRATVLGEPRRRFQLSKLIYGHLWNTLSRQPSFRARRALHINPTAARQQHTLRFISHSAGSESLREVELTPALELAWRLVEDCKQLPLNEIVARLASDPEVDSSLEEAQALLDALLDVGLFKLSDAAEPNSGDWLEPLIDACTPAASDAAETVRSFCLSMQEVLSQLAERPDEQREAALTRIRAELADTCKSLGVESLPGSTALLFEDVGIRCNLAVNASAAAQLVDRLSQALRWISSLDAKERGVDPLRTVADARFPGASSVPFMTFYAALVRQDPAHVSRDRKGASDPAGGATLTSPSWRERLRDYLAARWDADFDAVEIEFDFAELGFAEDEREAHPASYSIFGQLFSDDESSEPRLFVSALQSFVGYGKYFSRFLHVLPPQVTENLRARWELPKRTLYADVAFDGLFNGNLRPRILPARIGYPAATSSDHQGTIRLEDLEVVVPDDESMSLILRQVSTGKRVVPIDLGFLSPRFRPPLLKLLLRFTQPHVAMLPLPDLPAREIAPTSVVRRPRLTLRGGITVARQLWRVPAECIPRAVGGELAADTFLRFNEWRLKIGLPERVYVRLFARRKSSTQNEDARATRTSGDTETPGSASTTAPNPTASSQVLSADLAKPQFIDFSSPILVDILVRTCWNASNCDLVCEEEYPTPSQGPHVDGEPRMCELIIQSDDPLND